MAAVEPAVVRGQPLAIANARISATGPLSNLPYRVTGDGAWLRMPVKVDGSAFSSSDFA